MDAVSIINLLRLQKAVLKARFGVKSIGLFGSFAAGSAQPDSDVDLLVDLEEANYLTLFGLEEFLEQHLGRKTDIVRKGAHLKPSFLKSIEKNIIYA